MGVRADIFAARGYPDCSNGGISEGREALTLLRYDGAVTVGPFEPTEEAPPVIVIPGPLGHPTAVEAVYDGTDWVPRRDPERVGPMASGNYLRVRGAVAGAPDLVPLHDRWETPAQYEALSR